MWPLKPSQHSILGLRGNLAATEDLEQQIDVTHKIQGRFLSLGSSWHSLTSICWVEARDAAKHPAMHRTAGHVPLCAEVIQRNASQNVDAGGPRHPFQETPSMDRFYNGMFIIHKSNDGGRAGTLAPTGYVQFTPCLTEGRSCRSSKNDDAC